MLDYVSQREFAKRIGKSRFWVQSRIKEGVIPVNKEKEIPLEKGLNAVHAMNIALRKEGQAKAEKLTAQGIDTASAMEEVEKLTDSQVLARFNMAKMLEKEAVARLKELDKLEKEGKLLSMDDVLAVTEKLAANIREKLLTMSVRVAPLCEGRTQKEIQAVIDDEINDVLRGFQEVKYQ